MDIWQYHNTADQLIGSDRVQLRNLMGYYGATVDADDFPDDVYTQKHQDKYLRQGLSKATTEDEIGMAVFYATQMSGERIPELESVLLHSRDMLATVKYATEVLGSNWPELEKIILDEISSTTKSLFSELSTKYFCKLGSLLQLHRNNETKIAMR
jgi:hypothetical protein